MSRITAYVTSETCRTRDAVRPGTWIGEPGTGMTTKRPLNS